MNPILWLLGFLAVLAVVGFVWSALVAAGRADALMEAYEADQGSSSNLDDFSSGSVVRQANGEP